MNKEKINMPLGILVALPIFGIIFMHWTGVFLLSGILLWQLHETFKEPTNFNKVNLVLIVLTYARYIYYQFVYYNVVLYINSSFDFALKIAIMVVFSLNLIVKIMKMQK